MQRAERSAHALANQGVGRLVAIFRDGARVVVACWPQLLVIFLIGAAIRNATLWLAVKATLVHAFLGQAIMPIAPLATLVALVLMLRIADRELLRSASSDVPDSPQPVFTRSAVRRWSNDLLLATSVLVPFLAVYASYGLLQEDRVGYLHDVATDATASGVLNVNWDRLAVLQGWPLVATVIVAITLRKVLTGFKLSERSWRWAALVAYLEAVWVVILARYFEAQLRDIHSWVASRAVVVSLIHVKDQLIGLLGPLAPLVHHALGWLSEHFGSMGELLVIPVAWLAIGATISGTELPDAPDQLPVTFGAAQRERYTQRIAKIPSGVRRAAARIADPVVSPFQEVWESLRRLSVAGLVPMVLFCVIFVLASRIQVLMAWLGRWVVGPQSQRDQLMWQSYLSLVERTVYTVVIVALLSAAIRAIVGSPAGADDPSTEPPVRRAEVIAPGVAG